MEYLIQKGIAQRTAHHLVGALVNQAMEKGVSLAELPVETLQAAHPDLDASVRDILGVEKAVAAFRSYGSTAPVEVRRQIERWRGRLYGQEGQPIGEPIR
jgi:argininosuccinate lyase